MEYFIVPTKMGMNRKYILIDRNTFSLGNTDTKYIQSRSLFKILEETPSQERVLIFVSKVTDLRKLIQSYVNIYLKIKTRDLPFKTLKGLMEMYRFCFHQGKMTEEEKGFSMKYIRGGEVRHLFCTASLLTGIDIPDFNILVVYEATVYTPKERILNYFEYIQLVGRVGRHSKEGSTIYVVNMTNSNILFNTCRLCYDQEYQNAILTLCARRNSSPSRILG
jgi:superfamily II DNA/RNA helicase